MMMGGRGDQGDQEIHLLQDPDLLGILAEIKPPTSKMAPAQLAPISSDVSASHTEIVFIIEIWLNQNKADCVPPYTEKFSSCWGEKRPCPALWSSPSQLYTRFS